MSIFLVRLMVAAQIRAVLIPAIQVHLVILAAQAVVQAMRTVNRLPAAKVSMSQQLIGFHNLQE